MFLFITKINLKGNFSEVPLNKKISIIVVHFFMLKVVVPVNVYTVLWEHFMFYIVIEVTTCLFVFIAFIFIISDYLIKK